MKMISGNSMNLDRNKRGMLYFFSFPYNEMDQKSVT